MLRKMLFFHDQNYLHHSPKTLALHTVIRFFNNYLKSVALVKDKNRKNHQETTNVEKFKP